MFYYFGRKKQMAGRYPQPKHDTIIEPFAGSAAYSLHGENWRRNVILYEKSERLAKIWEWLISEANEDLVMAMPDLVVGETTTQLIHFLHTCSNAAFNMRTLTVSQFLADNWNRNKRYIAKNVHKVKGWQVHCCDYSLAPDVRATWFVDPPYSGRLYADPYEWGSKFIDYAALGTWVQSRKGQAICCEMEGADWIPLRALVTQSCKSGKTFDEMVYIHEDVTEQSATADATKESP